MKIELLDNKTVKVLLSRLDMNTFNLTYDEMDYKNPNTKKVLLQLLDEVKQQVKVDLTKGKLFIEAFPYADGGCMLYVNLFETLPGAPISGGLKKRKVGFDTPIICHIDGISGLERLIGQLFVRCSHMILKSSLYLLKGKYCLILYTYCKMDDEITRLLSEFGKICGKGPVCAAVIFEHAEPIIYENAIETLYKALV